MTTSVMNSFKLRGAGRSSIERATSGAGQSACQIRRGSGPPSNEWCWKASSTMAEAPRLES